MTAPITPRERARAKIDLAAVVTKRMDELLAGHLDEVADATRVGNGAGVYADPLRVMRALIAARAAIVQAHQIALNTAWPTNEDYDQS